MSKQKGTRNEHKTMKYLELRGYACTRAAASLGIFDVIAINRHQVRAIQVKTNRNAPPAERKAIRDFICPKCVSKEIWIWYDRVKQPKIRIL